MRCVRNCAGIKAGISTSLSFYTAANHHASEARPGSPPIVLDVERPSAASAPIPPPATGRSRGRRREPTSGPFSDPFSDPFRSTLKNGHHDTACAQVRAESRTDSRPDLIYRSGLFRSTWPPRPGIAALRVIDSALGSSARSPGPLASGPARPRRLPAHRPCSRPEPTVTGRLATRFGPRAPHLTGPRATRGNGTSHGPDGRADT
jgi:hypothetical protein